MAEVLSRPKFEPVIAREDATATLELMVTRCEMIEVTSAMMECRDPKDDKFLNLAIDGKADVIISRDPDLLVLHPFRHIPILNPADFIRWMAEGGVPSGASH